jgi:tetratricopeptide (TPR) repeat protein
LARELDSEGKLEEAIPHYVAYLEGVAHSDPRTQPAPRNLIAVVLRLAECQARTNRLRQAESSYDLAQKIAQQTGEKKLEAFSTISHAELEAKLGDKAQALSLYQHALALDQTLDDPRSAAADWYGYAQFLSQSGFEPRLAYACLLRAEALMKPFDKTPEFEPIRSARALTEEALGTTAAAIRQKPDSAIEEALHLAAH